MRLRLGAVVMLWTLAALYACFDPVPWKIAAPALAGLALAAIVVRDIRRFADAPIGPPQIAWIAATMFVVLALGLTLTGGIRSPLLLLMPVPALGLAFGAGRPRLVVPVLLILLAAVWTLALGDLLGPLAPIVPAALRDGPPAPAPAALTLTLATIATLALIVPSFLGIRIRRALLDADAEATRARAEHVATLQAHNRELLELTRTVAHELKNPLASIQGLAGLLARHQPPASREAERAGVLVDETKRLAALLDEFLNFSRPVQGLAVRPVEPAELTASLLRLFEARVTPHDLRIDAELATVRPLRCDPRKLQQVLVNLVDNAIAVSPPGARILVRVEDGADGGHAILVLDEGPGLPPAVRDKLFQPGTTTRHEGSGLGLAIARQIVRQHGGEISLTDRPGGGCLARVDLPRTPPEPA